MERIIKAVPMEDYRIKVTTASGLQGVFDVKPYLNGPAFQELKDPVYFNRVRADGYGISWPHEQDFSADTLMVDMKSAQHVNVVTTNNTE